jgi:ATP-dependent Lhr-like helicase
LTVATGHSLTARDRARRELLEETQHDRLAVRLLELHHRLDELAVHEQLLDVVRRRRQRLGPRGAVLADGAMRLAAPVLAHEVPHHRREPGAERPIRRRPLLQRGEAGVLRDVVGQLRVVRHEAPRQRPHPAGVRQQGIGIERGTARAHGFGGSHAEPSLEDSSPSGFRRGLAPRPTMAPVSLNEFHPAIRRWFGERLGEPTAAQRRGWPAVRTGKHVLIAAPTGSGKTLAAFLAAIDSLVTRGAELEDATRVVYVSPLKALANDVQKNLSGPLAEIRALDPTLPEVRVAVRSGDTTSSERARMLRRPPHILVTTPESLYILLTSEGGRGMLRGARTVIVDEVHAMLGDKRSSHLALSLERLDALAGPVQRIGLSATQKPLEDVGRFLVGAGRECTLIDEGHLREMDLAVEIPPSPLETVCSHETWSEIYGRIAELVREHRTTLVFVGTRKMAERVAAELEKLLGADAVGCHHSSLSKERRLDAEQRLKAGSLRALVATASLELGIDIGDVDLAVQVGATRSIATFIQRIGRSGHGVGRRPKGRLFPLTQDELVEAAALLRAVRLRVLDRTPQPPAPLDILAQQVVAACAAETWDEDELFACVRRAWPYRLLERAQFDAVVALHAQGRRALLHRDGVNGRLRGTRRARMVATSSGGAIADTAQYRVVLEPTGTFIGTIDEDFAVESNAGDVFQLGNASWRVLRVEQGLLRVADAHGTPPSLPFWLGEGPSRTTELSAEIGAVREAGVERAWHDREGDLPEAARGELARFLAEGERALGAVPTQRCIVLERFFDESGGTQLVVHAPFGGRINRAFGLALRKRFCRHFGFELQAAANEEAIVLSLGVVHSFPLEEVFDYLRPETVEALLTQAVLATPLFTARWRWNVSRALLLERVQGSKRVPPPLVRMRAEDLLTQAFPQAVACGETLAPGDIPIPLEHPIVAQTIQDCLRQALDVDGLIDLLRGLRDGTIRKVAIDTPEPSPFARSVLAVKPYGFLDDAPLEERRTQAVIARRASTTRAEETLGALDPDAVARVREEAWPDPRDAEELHEALLWMGFATEDEARPWGPWLAELAAAGRVELDGGRWFAAEATRDPLAVLRGRMEALGPVRSDEPLLFELERQGIVMRTRLDGETAWCDRRLLARIQRYTLERLREQIRPVSGAEFAAFVAAWQHRSDERRLDGPAGLLEVVRKLAGFEIKSRRLGAARARPARPALQAGMAGLPRAVGTGRVGPAVGLEQSRAAQHADLPGAARRARVVGRARRRAGRERAGLAGAGAAGGAAREGRAVPGRARQGGEPAASDVERGLRELVSFGLATSDSFASLRGLLRNSKRAREHSLHTGRWSLLRAERPAVPGPEFVARALLRRWGVVFRAAVARERQPVPWRDVVRACRTLEMRGEIRGGRFVAGFSGEQFALGEAIPLLRRMRGALVDVASLDDPVLACMDMRPEAPLRAPADARR